MKEQINNLLNKGLKYLELYMKNGREIILYKPNQESSNYTIELEENYAVVNIKFDNGCIDEQVIPYTAISYLNGIHGCPTSASSGE